MRRMQIDRRPGPASGRLAAAVLLLASLGGCVSPGLGLGEPTGCWARQWDVDNDGRVSFAEYELYRKQPQAGWVERGPVRGNPVECVVPLTAGPSGVVQAPLPVPAPTTYQVPVPRP